MKLYEILILLLFGFVFSSCLCHFLSSNRKLEANLNDIKNETCSKRFIAESFRKTCNGTGFKDLEEWQLVCRSLFSLDYIAWCDAEEFMIDPVKEEAAESVGLCNFYEIVNDNTLFYGKWMSSDDSEINGEVYCRNAKWSEN